MNKTKIYMSIIMVFSLLLSSCVFTGAITIYDFGDNENVEVEIFYGTAFDSADNFKMVGTKLVQDHPPLPFTDDSFAIYTIRTGCSPAGVSDGSLKIGVKFYSHSGYSWVGGPDLYVKNYVTGELFQRKKSMGNQDNFEWKWCSISNECISRSGEVQFKVHSVYSDDVTIAEVGVEYIDSESIDQSQKNFNGVDLVNSGKYFAQSFKTKFQQLSRVKLLLNTSSINSGQINVMITPNLDNGDNWDSIISKLTSPYILLKDSARLWVEVDFERDIDLIPGNTYYIIVCWGTGIYNWCFSDENPYSDGESYYSNSPPADPDATWSSQSSKDFCFLTYGKEESDLEPNLSVDTTDVDFGNVEEDEFPKRQYVHISNDGNGTLLWEVTSYPDWIDVGDDSGKIYPGKSDESVSISVKMGELEIGQHSADLVIKSKGIFDKSFQDKKTIEIKINVEEDSDDVSKSIDMLRVIFQRFNILENLVETLRDII